MRGLVADLAHALGGRIGIGQARLGDGDDLRPEEAAAMARATPARRAEFAAGRTAARAGLRAIGLVPLPIPMAPDRSPIWPRGVIGSISHDGDQAMAIVTRYQGVAGLGLDMEPHEDLPCDLWETVLTPAETCWLTMRDAAARGPLARMIFSAKEASYKALYPLTGAVVGFDAMTIRPDPDRRRFTARLNIGFGPYGPGTELTGHLLTHADRIVTALVLPPADECGQNRAAIPDMEMQCFHANPPEALEI
ncbi:4'-phosphopantetheinyl transferase family protein [Alterinioella nitratireducens]|uniref:4'-phosphopantetheinyl transferase family protein n=1 Tax=Alterinioella nitratireducens TaxID=2735915 RepID=UPI0040591AD4